jgi:ribosomal protein S18 acetylase RimI-like enzyme
MASGLGQDFHIHPPALQLADRCEPVLRSVPEWFGIEEAIIEYLEVVERLPTILCTTSEEAIGFMSVEQHFPRSFELHVLAVRPEWHRHGVGRALLVEAENHVASSGGGFLQVKTLSSKGNCEYYDRTRRWYEAMGFVPQTEFPDLWGEGTPCLQMIKTIRTSDPAS